MSLVKFIYSKGKGIAVNDSQYFVFLIIFTVFMVVTAAVNIFYDPDDENSVIRPAVESAEKYISMHPLAYLPKESKSDFPESKPFEKDSPGDYDVFLDTPVYYFEGNPFFHRLGCPQLEDNQNRCKKATAESVMLQKRKIPCPVCLPGLNIDDFFL